MNESDLINLISLIIGVLNYQENLTQNDKQQIMENSNNAQDIIVNKINSHLIEQDKKIDLILKKLEELNKR